MGGGTVGDVVFVAAVAVGRGDGGGVVVSFDGRGDLLVESGAIGSFVVVVVVVAIAKR